MVDNQLEKIAKALYFAGYFASTRNYTQPKIGDLVFEVTSVQNKSIPFVDRVGTLKQGDVIETLDGRDIPWSNHRFKTIPESFEYGDLLGHK